MLAVSDTGTGMDAETQSHVFEPFFTTKEPGKGTGLGLATVYGIVKQSGGYIWLYSEMGKGTAFKIYLPRVDEPPEVTGEAHKLPAEPASASETVLLVEDEPALRELILLTLQKYGYTVLEAADAVSAMQIAEQHQGKIQLLVTDVVMPGIGGRELATRLARLRPEMKVLYISGYPDQAILHRGMLEPGLAFLQKPFTAADLTRKVREVLDTEPRNSQST
jgi:CheY-like chemotaxis protein